MKTPLVYLSKCCGKIAVEDFREDIRDHDNPVEIYTCAKCKQECDVQDEPVCKYCLGKGEVLVSGKVYANEPHEALVDTEKCECMITEPDHEPSQDKDE